MVNTMLFVVGRVLWFALVLVVAFLAGTILQTVFLEIFPLFVD